MMRTPYLTDITPVPGTVAVALNTTIEFKILTDTGTDIDPGTINVWINNDPVIEAGVGTNPLYAVTITAIAQGRLVEINPNQDLEVAIHRLDVNASDDNTVYGEDYFEFSTDQFSYEFQVNAVTPLTCPYDLQADPYSESLNDVTSNFYFNKFTSPTAYWGSRGVVAGDRLQATGNTTSGEYIIKSLDRTEAVTYERPRDSLNDFSLKTFKRRKFSSVNPAKATCNGAVTYPFMKLWGATRMRYLAGYPSVTGFPVPFTQQPDAGVYTRTDGVNEGILDDLSIQDPPAVPINKQKFLKFSISSNSVSGANYDRYWLPFTLISPLQIGGRVLFQFSFTSMAANTEVYFGLSNNTGQPSADGNSRSGVAFRRVVTSTADQIHTTVYHGTATSTRITTGINYEDFLDTLWLGELEVVASGTTRFKLYNFLQDLDIPVVSRDITGGGNIDVSNFSVTSFGTVDALAGAAALGALYYVDVEPNPSGVGPYTVFSLTADVSAVTAKWRPYANVLPVTLTTASGLKTLTSKCSMLPLGTESDTKTEYHVLDLETTLATIDVLKPEALVSVLAAEDPTINDAANANANQYRRAVSMYETADTVAGILFISKVGGTTGNSYSIEIIKPGPSTPFSLTTASPHTEIILATDGAGAVTTTIQDIVTAVEQDTSTLVNAAPVGITSHLAEALPFVTLSGGAEYKVSGSSRFNDLTLKIRSNKTGAYYVTMSDNTVYGGFGGATLMADGTFITTTPVFQPTDVGKTVHIPSAENATNVGNYTIMAVINSQFYRYPTDTVLLNRNDFAEETNSFMWSLDARDQLLSSGRYTKINTPLTIALRTADFNNLADGKRTLSVYVCKNMIVSNSVLLDCEATVTV